MGGGAVKEKGGGRVGVVHIKCRSKWGGSSVCEAATLLGGPPEVRGAGAESGSGQIGSVPAPGKKMHCCSIFISFVKANWEGAVQNCLFYTMLENILHFN